MAQNNLDTAAMDAAVAALNTYINDVNDQLAQMADAATDCHDNMAQDDLSQRAIDKLNECIGNIRKELEFAKEVQKRILTKKKEIEDELSKY